MMYFDEKDWDFAKEILKPDYYYMLLSKWRDLGEDQGRMLRFLEEERERFKQEQALKIKKKKK